MSHPDRNRRMPEDRIEFDCTGEESVVHGIVRVLAILNDVSITELDPLYGSVEGEALGKLIRHASKHNCSVGIEFMVKDYTVVIDDNECVRIHDGPPVLIGDQKDQQ